jgi:metacaspase-1
MNPRARLTIVFDCCHSGSAVELPFVYRPDSHGKVNLIDNVKQGIGLINAASSLLKGGFSASKIQEEHFVEDWKNEGKDVWMFSGCADDQTSADTSIAGAATGLSSHLLCVTCG